LVGFNVGIDAKLDYGESLNGFMRQINESKHVLMIIDRNYVERVNKISGSGVWKENEWIRESINSKPKAWLSVIYIDNPEYELPEWMKATNPKGFNFNYNENIEMSAGASQIDDIWRWVAGLPCDKTNAVSLALIRERMSRVEYVDNMRDPGSWRCPEIEGRGIRFEYSKEPHKTFTIGAGLYEFCFTVSSRSYDSIYVYMDYIKAVGNLPENISIYAVSSNEAMQYIQPGRTISLSKGRGAVLLSKSGCICLIHLVDVQPEVNTSAYMPASVIFDYYIITEEGSE
jgi:hypothetical protein